MTHGYSSQDQVGQPRMPRQGRQRRLGSLGRLLFGGLVLTGLSLAGCSTAPEAETAAPGESLPAIDPVVTQREGANGAPTVIWLNRDAAPVAGGTSTTVAWQTLKQAAPVLKLSQEALAATRLNRLHEQGDGVIIAQFEQLVDGIEVFGRTLNIALTRDLRPIGVTGGLSATVESTSTTFAVPSTEAVSAALARMTGAGTVITPGDPRGGDSRYQAHQFAAFNAGGTRVHMASQPRSKQVFFPAKKELIPAYYIELDVSLEEKPDSMMRAYVVSARDGSVLFEHDLTANDQYTYRVWADSAGSYTPWDGPHGNEFTPHPTGKPDGTTLTFKPSSLVKLQNVPFSKNDPWLPPMAMEARGNNAVAYADKAFPDGFGMGDVMLKPSMPGEFDYALDVATTDPAKDNTTIQAVTANFFFVVNHLHDTFYDAGWDEVSRNPQQDNFMRGGMDKDPIKAESQDASGRNNANASTPADGASPRIQMFLFDPTEDALKVNSPMDVAGAFPVGKPAFGPKKYDVTGDLVIVNDGKGMSNTDGCEAPFMNAAALVGKIAVIDRGTCQFEIKVNNAQLAGAKGAIIINNVPGAPNSMAAGTPAPMVPTTIPSAHIAQDVGQRIVAKLTAGTAVSLTLKQSLDNNDSSLDAMIVSHEWGHVLSNRLIGNGTGLSSNQGRSMGEGWSDFVATLVTTRATDAMAPANANWMGAFAAAGYSLGPAGNSAYYGIRRYPYSIDMSKNPLTFKHIQNGIPLPMMPAPAFGETGTSNAQVHNSGEVWSNTLWECFIALVKDAPRYTFDQAQKAMREYLVAGMKLTPNAPTMLEARDALLMAAVAKSEKDFELFARAFAKRGMGVGAQGPAKASFDHKTVVESFNVGGQIVVDSITLTDEGRSCDDDKILDKGELGVLKITVKNTGTLPISPRATVANETSTATFPRGNVAVFPTIKPYQTGTAKILVLLNSAASPAVMDFRIAVNAANLAVPGAVSISRSFTGNYDLVPNSSSDDSMDDPSDAWTVTNDKMYDGTYPWKHVREGGAGRWSIIDHSVTTDHYLVTPPLQVAATGSFGFSVMHRWDMEADSFSNYDGGVIEISQDGGMTWQDAAAAIKVNGYNGQLWSLNTPLRSRRAFVKRNPDYPGFSGSTVDFGTMYAGKTVQIRFRLGTDSSEGAEGWDLDEIRFTGVTNTPFPSRQAGRGCPGTPLP